MNKATCCVDGCNGPRYEKSWCCKHYKAWWKYGDPLINKTKVKHDRPCLVDGCERLAYVPGAGRGWCPLHYGRWQAHGDTADRPRTRSVCIIEGCELLIVGQGWCSKHYTRAARCGDPVARFRGEVVDGRRVCPKCEEDLPLDQFGPGHIAGLASYCKSCTRAITAAWRQANPQYVPPPKDPAKVKEWSRLWREANPDQMRAQAALYRARKYHAGAERFAPVEVFDRDGWVCGICAELIDHDALYPDVMSISLDHIIPLSKGGHHTRANTQASHLLCNMRKHNTLAA